MASYQRIALFIFFDALERDLAGRIAAACSVDCPEILSEEERGKARARLGKRAEYAADASDLDLLNDLDLGEKYSILMRHKSRLDQAAQIYYQKKQNSFSKAIPVRNATMHGRPLTTEEYSIGFSLAQEFLQSPTYWPNLSSVYKKYSDDPEAVLSVSIKLLDDEIVGEALNNLPTPDYDDTGFLPRPSLERDLRA